MRILSLILLSLSLISLYGCTTFSSYSRVEPQLASWEKDDEYGRSLDALSQIDPKDPDYTTAAKRRKQIEKDAANYERRIRRETQQKLNKGDWAAALDQYDEALSKHPKSSVIKDGLAKLNRQQQETLEALERKRLIQHGKWLRDLIPVYKDIARINPRSYDAQNKLGRITSEAEEIASELAVIGNKALADNNLNVANTTLLLAADLSDALVISESLNTLRAKKKQAKSKKHRLQQEKTRKAKALEEKRQRRLNQLLSQYKQALAQQDYVSARSQLLKIEEISPHNSSLSHMRSSLQATIDNKVSDLFAAGVSAYSRGHFEEAVQQWRDTLLLDENHQQAKENLERAEKVLENIKNLKTKQGL